MARRGKHQVGTIASGERGVNTTMVVCCSAAGQYVAPMIIFKRKRMMVELGTGAPPGCLVEISDSGYINSDLFVVWLQQFISVVKPTKENKVLLVLDGHTTHSKNLAAVHMARDNGVILLQLPGHTTHRLQPLDISVFKPLETYYNQAVEKWMREHPGLAVTQFQVAELLGQAYGKAATVENSVNGFRKCGIWPVNRHVFADVDFAASDALLNKQNIDHVDAQVDNQIGDKQSSEENSSDDSDDDVPLAQICNKKMLSSKSTLNVSIQEILPCPSISDAQEIRKSRGAQKAQILTTTPYKEELELKQASVDQKKLCAAKRKLSSNLQMPSIQKALAKQVAVQPDSQVPRSPTISTKKIKVQPDPQMPNSSKVLTKKIKVQSNSQMPSTLKSLRMEFNINAEEWYCRLCTNCVVEDMIQCKKCTGWVHESCANIVNAKYYICDICA